MTDLPVARANSKRRFPPIGRIRSRTLLLLRWIAVVGQLAAVMTVYVGLGWDLPILWCVAAIVVAAGLNTYISLAHPATKRLSENEVTAFLSFDLVQLAVLLYLTGGLHNPFSVLFLAPVVISATSLSLRNTMILIAIAGACTIVLAYVHLPLPWQPGVTFEPLPLYTLANMVALLLGLLFTSIYAWRVAVEARSMSDALAATQAILEREHRLAALGALAAAAAHELGTPLATIALVSKELKRDLGEDPAVGEDIALLGSEVERCREILSKLGQAPEDEYGPINMVPLDSFLEELADQHLSMGIEIKLDLPSQAHSMPVPLAYRSPELIHGLGNIFENAIDFANRRVTLQLGWTDKTVELRIMDDGPGFATEVIDRLGDPYVTTRRRQTVASSVEEPADAFQGHGLHDEGLGLGFFIAKTLLERTGASLAFANLRSGGAEVRLDWDRELLETEPGPAI